MLWAGTIVLLRLVLPAGAQVTTVWSHQDGTAAQEHAYGMAVDPMTKAVVLAGWTEGNVDGNTLTGTQDVLAVKLDQDGVKQWTYQAGEVGSSSQIYGVAIDGSGNVVLVGRHQGNGYGPGIDAFDMAVVMLNSAGVFSWSVQQGSTANDVATCVAFDASGNILVGGFTDGTISGETFQGGTRDAVLLKLNNAGVQQWLKATELGTSGWDTIYALTTDASDNIFVTGDMGASFDSNTYYGAVDAFILKTDSAGTFQWSYQTGSTGDDIGAGIGISLTGDIYGAGQTTGSLPGNTNIGTNKDAFIVKLDALGVQQWLIQIGTATDSRDVADGLAVHPSSGNFAIYGYTNGDFNGESNAGLDDWWAAEYDPTGALRWSYLHGTAADEERLHAGSFDRDGDLILAGRNNIANVHNFWAVKLSPPTSTTSSMSTSSTSITSTSTFRSSTSTSETSTSVTSTSSSSTSSISTSLSSTSFTSTSLSSTSSMSTSLSSTSSMSTSVSSTSSLSTSLSRTSFTSTSSTSRSSSTSWSTSFTSTSSSFTASSSSTFAAVEATTETAVVTVVYLTRAELDILELQRREAAVATVLMVESVEDAALGQVLADLANSSEVLVVTVPTELGEMKVATLPVAGLEAAGETLFVDAEGANASVEVATAMVEEIVAALGLEGPLLLSVGALNENGTASFEMDAIVGEASTLVSAALSINFRSSDGSRIEVKDLVNPIQFSLESTNPDAKCAFWDEDVAKWSMDGVTTISSSNGILQCSTRHLSIFGAVLNVVLSNIVLALKCSTLGSLLSGPGFENLLKTDWLWSTPSILNLIFHGLGVVCVLLAWLFLDRQQERAIPRQERELFLMRVKVDEKTQTSETDARPSRCECFKNSWKYVSHATGYAVVETLDMARNAGTAAVNQAISTLQSHKARVARAQIGIFNKLQMKGELRWESNYSEVCRSASDLLEKSVDRGQAAAETFLQRGWLGRVLVLWPASHPLLKIFHFSMQAPVRASVALVFLKISSAGALSAIFFSSSTPTPDSDPACEPPASVLAQVVQSLTVGFITALFGDVIIYVLFAMQMKKVVFSKTEWTEKRKRRQRFRWNMWSFAFWLIVLLYGSFCELYICLFLANVRDQDRLDWLHSMGITLLDVLVVKSVVGAFAMATIATLVLCFRPKVIERVEAKWIKDGKTGARDGDDGDDLDAQSGRFLDEDSEANREPQAARMNKTQSPQLLSGIDTSSEPFVEVPL